jgi:hypothetical protein
MSQKVETVTPTNGFAAQDAPDFEPGFVPDEYELENVGATVVNYTFDGPNEAGGSLPVPVATNDLHRRTIRTKGQKLWLEDGAGTGSVRVIARTDA